MTNRMGRTHTPATALAGLLNHISIVLRMEELDDAQRLAQIAEAKQWLRPAAERFLEQERIARDVATITTAIGHGAQVLYSAESGQPARITVVLNAEQEGKSEVFKMVRQLSDFERELRETGQASAYTWDNALGGLVPTTVTCDSEQWPPTDEDAANGQP